MKTILLSMLLLSNYLLAAPAFPGNMEFKQADGSYFTGNLKGDEYLNWVENKQGKVIVYNKKSNTYEYGELEVINGELELSPSGISATNNNQVNKSSSLGLQNFDKEQLYKIWNRKIKQKSRYISKNSNN